MGLPERVPDNAAPGGAIILKIRVALKGRPLRVYKFTKSSILVGRDPHADIFLDNPGVSRAHLRLAATPSGIYTVEDLGSANGARLNDGPLPAKPAQLMHNDVLHVGKFTLWASYERERRGTADDPPLSPSVFRGTTVLSSDDLDRVMGGYGKHASEAERAAGPVPVVPAPGRAAPGMSRATVVLIVFIAVLVGIAGGALAVWTMTHPSAGA